MIKRKKILYDDKDEFQLLTAIKDDTLTLVLPGAGYHTDLPVFYFISQLIATNLGHVLQVKHSSTSLETAEKVFNDVVKKGNYKNLLIVGKSAGTTKANRLLRKFSEYNFSKIIWLTPLIGNDKLYESLLQIENKSLIIIGDKDRHYNPERILELNKRDNFTVKVIENATHSLEFYEKEKVSESIKILKNVIEFVKDFLNE